MQGAAACAAVAAGRPLLLPASGFRRLVRRHSGVLFGVGRLLREAARFPCLLAALRHGGEQYLASGLFVANLLPHTAQRTDSTALIFLSILALHRLQ